MAEEQRIVEDHRLVHFLEKIANTYCECQGESNRDEVDIVMSLAEVKYCLHVYFSLIIDGLLIRDILNISTLFREIYHVSFFFFILLRDPSDII